MFSQRPRHDPPSEITPRDQYLRRRQWLQLALAGSVAGLGGTLAACTPKADVPGATLGLRKLSGASKSSLNSDEALTAYQHATSYNNFYEFGTGKSDPASYARQLSVEPWTVVVEGEVAKPRSFGIEDLLRLPLEERIYRLRCVEAWSMVIPWIGFEFNQLAKLVEPTSKAKFVEFVTAAQPENMIGLRSSVLHWPYTEGLRIDEAMHPLTILAVEADGEVLPNQNGAPVRLVVPWKYGFKSAKSLVAIRFTDKQPGTAWNKAAANEYGFYSNVNPDVDHPRWSQATERRIGEDGLFARKRKTLMFNGYEAQVGQLYAGMDLKKNY